MIDDLDPKNVAQIVEYLILSEKMGITDEMERRQLPAHSLDA